MAFLPFKVNKRNLSARTLGSGRKSAVSRQKRRAGVCGRKNAAILKPACTGPGASPYEAKSSRTVILPHAKAGSEPPLCTNGAKAADAAQLLSRAAKRVGKHGAFLCRGNDREAGGPSCAAETGKNRNGPSFLCKEKGARERRFPAPIGQKGLARHRQANGSDEDIEMEYSFNLFNKLAPTGLVLAMEKLLDAQRAPVVLCIGSDLAIGDSLGPVCGTLLREKAGSCFVYGTLQQTVTAKEVKYMNDFLRETHPGSPVIAVDAAVGDAGDIGLIKISDRGIKPGLGANKNLGRVGDVGIMGIVAEKSLFNYSLLNLTRLNLVYRMADIISEAVSTFLAPLARTAG